MNNYNDFPSFSNEQYRELSSAYKTQFQEPPHHINELVGILRSCILSLPNCKGIKRKVTALQSQLETIVENIVKIFPSSTPKAISRYSNPFEVTKNLINCLKILEKIINNKNYQKNTIILNKIQKDILDCTYLLLDTLSHSNYKFFDYM